MTLSGRSKLRAGHFIRFAIFAASGVFAEHAFGEPVTLLELYTSQSCYSCPPAEKLLADNYLDRPDVLALEFHVDYWDDLVYGSAGKWKDPYSDAMHTDRQRAYAQVVGGGSVYTPQMIVHGAFSLSGTAGGKIDAAIEQVSAKADVAGWDVKFERGPDGLVAEVIAGAGEAIAFVAKFVRSAKTEIPAGENKGKVLLNNNVVVDWITQGRVRADEIISVGEPGAGESCAVILQRPGHGIVIGAWRCPQA